MLKCSSVNSFLLPPTMFYGNVTALQRVFDYNYEVIKQNKHTDYKTFHCIEHVLVSSACVSWQTTSQRAVIANLGFDELCDVSATRSRARSSSSAS